MWIPLADGLQNASVIASRLLSQRCSVPMVCQHSGESAGGSLKGKAGKAMKFFIPHLRDDSAAAEQEWLRYLRATSAPPGSRRVHSVTYQHDRAKYVVRVGEPRLIFRRKTGPRGGYIKNADYVSYSSATGTVVSGIVDTGAVLHVWSYGPPFGGWANPSMIGRNEVISIEYFEEPGNPAS